MGGIGQKIAQIVSGNSLFLNPPQWTDKSFPANRDRQGVAQKPDFDFVNLGLLFPQNDATEEIYILDQMLHQKKLGTPIRLHVHFVQDSAAIPNFVCNYRYYNNGDTVPAFTEIETDNGPGAAFEWESGSIINIIQFPEISAPAGGENVSAMFDMIMHRDDNRVSGDVLVKYVDYHFQIDSLGSRQELIK